MLFLEIWIQIGLKILQNPPLIGLVNKSLKNRILKHYSLWETWLMICKLKIINMQKIG